MSIKRIFEGQAIKSELVVLILDKHGLHPTQHDDGEVTDPDDLERPTFVTVPAEEFDRANQVLHGESDKDRFEF